MIGALTLLDHIGASHTFIGPGAVAGALILVLGPWLWQLAAGRTERIRLAERAEVAARIHDSVLQTLALVQRHASDAPARDGSRAPPGARAAPLALRQRLRRVRDLCGCAGGRGRRHGGGARRAHRAGERGRRAARRPPRATRARRARGDDERRQAFDRRTRSPSTRKPGPRRSPSSCATAASASTPPPSPATDAASAIRSRHGCRGPAEPPRSSRSPARAPRSS